MRQKIKDIQNRYESFLKTPSLWKGNAVLDLTQFKSPKKTNRITIDVNKKLRLGKYIERLVSFQLSQEDHIDMLCENIQIQQNKRTLGELDCIIKRDNTVIHLEIIYKFYLYDCTVGTSEIDHFIGPNRKDSLIEKLTKLKEKQLPLLYTKECKEYLNSINLQASQIAQQVYFKAQLFIPFSKKNITLEILNNDCISGYYLNHEQLSQFSNCKFYIPNKKDWIIKPCKNVNWMNYPDFTDICKEFYHKKYSPLCWFKQENGVILKIFMIWW
ncbi:DUF1853 family protein [Polaribacter aquimarinus]|uniref:DUF1853 domain-containing protein n=1 Tax=Polaribacter aquimarinus TaxID=2100726 RepID=A0A2U2J9P1_9FLAO|nr:DUF1853 family protein [Polaribacter aquimarinus]PWG05059.1 DUF1853 domain-containing protein [Polaribacter aquimarinus]